MKTDSALKAVYLLEVRSDFTTLVSQGTGPVDGALSFFILFNGKICLPKAPEDKQLASGILKECVKMCFCRKDETTDLG